MMGLDNVDSAIMQLILLSHLPYWCQLCCNAIRPNTIKLSQHLLAPTGALIVTVVYYIYIDPQAATFLRFRAYLPIYLVFLFEN